MSAGDRTIFGDLVCLEMKKPLAGASGVPG
jgi:hypothetical protein